MSKFSRLRTWANRDDGSVFQIGNRSLTAVDVLGYLLQVAALIVYILYDKTGFDQTWIGWLFLIAGLLLIMISEMRRAGR